MTPLAPDLLSPDLIETARLSTAWPFEDISDAAVWFDAAPIAEADRIKIGRTNALRLFNLEPVLSQVNPNSLNYRSLSPVIATSSAINAAGVLTAPTAAQLAIVIAAFKVEPPM